MASVRGDARLQSEDGFSLIELLVVVLIVGLLAGVALPLFLNQRTKGQDANAKTAVRDSVSEIESCFSTTQTYAGCPTNTASPGGGQVALSNDTGTTFTVTATSKSGNTFSITKNGNSTTRECTVAMDRGGCQPGDTW